MSRSDHAAAAVSLAPSKLSIMIQEDGFRNLDSEEKIIDLSSQLKGVTNLDFYTANSTGADLYPQIDVVKSLFAALKENPQTKLNLICRSKVDRSHLGAFFTELENNDNVNDLKISVYKDAGTPWLGIAGFLRSEKPRSLALLLEGAGKVEMSLLTNSLLEEGSGISCNSLALISIPPLAISEVTQLLKEKRNVTNFHLEKSKVSAELVDALKLCPDLQSLHIEHLSSSPTAIPVLEAALVSGCWSRLTDKSFPGAVLAADTASPMPAVAAIRGGASSDGATAVASGEGQSGALTEVTAKQLDQGKSLSL